MEGKINGEYKGQKSKSQSAFKVETGRAPHRAWTLPFFDPPMSLFFLCSGFPLWTNRILLGSCYLEFHTKNLCFFFLFVGFHAGASLTLKALPYAG